MIKQRQTSAVERAYAEALLSAARAAGTMQRTRDEAQSVLEIVRKSPRLLLFLESPHISIQEKEALLDRVFKGRLSPLMMKLLRLLAERRRTMYLDETLEYFQERAEQAEGIWQASVTTAFTLGLQDRLRLKAALEKYTGAQLKIDYEVDPNLIGGVVFRFRDLLIDSSLRGGLETLRQKLEETTLGVNAASV